ncbi:MAG TPA: DUF402 domain-containing protein [Roseiflexaceae bacterium]|jgi:protein associated with RNAse G/E|nr:DUF402 domain-containing protein [Roseiflexaceae bacterium]
MQTYTVHLLKPGKNTTITYQGVLIAEEQGHILIHARWDRPSLDLGYTTFETGDHFYEHYYTDRWFNIFEIHSAAGMLKGWYCNVTRPACMENATITSEDLELDLFVSADRSQLLTLDADEFVARNFEQSDPDAYTAALDALAQLQHMAQTGMPPFDAAP